MLLLDSSHKIDFCLVTGFYNIKYFEVCGCTNNMKILVHYSKGNSFAYSKMKNVHKVVIPKFLWKTELFLYYSISLLRLLFTIDKISNYDYYLTMIKFQIDDNFTRKENENVLNVF